MKIKSAFIFGITIFLLFILFRNSIKDDVGQLVFVTAFMLLEGFVLYSIIKAYRKQSRGR